MFEVNGAASAAQVDYDSLAKQLNSLLGNERDFIANSAQFSAFIYQVLPELNWAGFYLFDGQELVLGPFQGKVACVRIALGCGVCGAAAQQRETIVVPDVHAFPGHIACDRASRAEIVLPIVVEGRLLGVFDIDSPVHGRFNSEDALGLQALLAIYVASTGFPKH